MVLYAEQMHPSIHSGGRVRGQAHSGFAWRGKGATERETQLSTDLIRMVITWRQERKEYSSNPPSSLPYSQPPRQLLCTTKPPSWVFTKRPSSEQC